jgi:2-polyprenyl-3-methyl-5-hydroxy-6-metoxy-1,4-benzoquinol methylase
VGNPVDNDELGVAYSNWDPKGYYKDIETATKKKMASAIINLKELIPHSARIIDIGTGNGLFVDLLNKAGFRNVSAHEIPGSDISRISGMTGNTYQDFDYRSVPFNYFDSITLLDVFEHVIDPKHLIKICSKILKINGVVYLHTPVVTKIDRIMHLVQEIPILKKIGNIWQQARTSIFHLEIYTPKALKHILEQAGFSDIKIKLRNELSWPLRRYIRVYLFEKQGLPGSIAPIFYPMLYPLLGTDFFHPNKAIVSARKVKDLD